MLFVRRSKTIFRARPNDLDGGRMANETHEGMDWGAAANAKEGCNNLATRTVINTCVIPTIRQKHTKRSPWLRRGMSVGRPLDKIHSFREGDPRRVILAGTRAERFLRGAPRHVPFADLLSLLKLLQKLQHLPI